MVSKIEVHTSSVTLLVVQISKFVFNCRKLCEPCVLFVNIYNLTLSKPLEFFIYFQDIRRIRTNILEICFLGFFWMLFDIHIVQILIIFNKLA
jgi:hypothetical protein